MLLQEGIRIYCPHPCKDRVYISNGQTSPADSQLQFYRAGAFIPKKPWREPTDAEIDLLFSNQPDLEYQENIGITKIPDSIAAQFMELGINRVTSYDDLFETITKSESKYLKAQNELDEYVDGLLVIKQSKQKHNIIINPAGMETLTVNTNTGNLTGMHVDDWDQLALGELHKSRNRICINLGLQDRFFLYVNLTLTRIRDLLAEKTDFSKSGKRQIAAYFYSHFPEYPIIKLRVKPFEAYIAPTENVIHDGCTEGIVYKDIQLTLRGFYKIANNVSVSEY
jgi:hypothetical protein